MVIINEIEGDIFSTHSGRVLIHSCNAVGAWGSGVAIGFKNHYPAAFKKYKAYCRPVNLSKEALAQHKNQILGTCCLVKAEHYDKSTKKPDAHKYIACLITSKGWGSNKSNPTTVLTNTHKSLQHLKRQLDSAGLSNAFIYTVPINSGNFKVDWKYTKLVLEKAQLRMMVLRSNEKKMPKVEKANRYNHATLMTTVEDVAAQTTDSEPAPESSAQFENSAVEEASLFIDYDDALEIFASERLLAEEEEEEEAPGPSNPRHQKRARSVSPDTYASQETKHQRTSFNDAVPESTPEDADGFGEEMLDEEQPAWW